MSNKYKDLEGSVPVNGDITPITRKPIAQIDVSDPASLTTSELIEQRNALSNRIDVALTMGQDQLVLPMRRGLALIDAILKERMDNEDTHLI